MHSVSIPCLNGKCFVYMWCREFFVLGPLFKLYTTTLVSNTATKLLVCMQMMQKSAFQLTVVWLISSLCSCCVVQCVWESAVIYGGQQTPILSIENLISGNGHSTAIWGISTAWALTPDNVLGEIADVASNYVFFKIPLMSYDLYDSRLMSV